MLSHKLNILEFWKSWGSWYGGEIIGGIAIAPFLLIHVVPGIRGFLILPPETLGRKDLKSRRKQFRIGGVIELTVQFLSILVAPYIVLSRLSTGAHFMFPLFLPIIWIAMTGGVRRAATGNVLLVAALVGAEDLSPGGKHSVIAQCPGAFCFFDGPDCRGSHQRAAPSIIRIARPDGVFEFARGKLPSAHRVLGSRKSNAVLQRCFSQLFSI